MGGKKRPPVGGGSSIGQGTSNAKDGDGKHASPGLGCSAGVTKPTRGGAGGLGGRTMSNSGKATATPALAKLPAVEGRWGDFRLSSLCT